MHYSKNVRVGGGKHDVPMETVPRLVNINGEPHILAYISRDEAAQLRRQGGGVTRGGGQLKGPGGVPAFEDGMAEGNRGGGDGGEFSMGAGWGGDGTQMAADGGRAEGNQGAIGGVSGDLSNADFGGRTGVATDSVSRGGGVMGVEGNVSNDVSDGNFGGKTGAESSSVSNDGYQGGSLDKGFFGGAANYGQEGGFSGGGGSEAATSSSGQIAQANPPPAPAAPTGPTQAEIDAENARLRKKAEDDAEALVRAAFGAKFNDPYYAARKQAYLDNQNPEIAAARAKSLSDLMGALAPSGLEATPLANRGAAGIGTAAEKEGTRLGTLGDAEVGDYTKRVGGGLAAEIARVRGAADPNAAYLSGTPGAIQGIDTDIVNRPLADFIASLGYSPDAVQGMNVSPPTSLVEALRARGGAQLFEPARSGMVG